MDWWMRLLVEGGVWRVKFFFCYFYWGLGVLLFCGRSSDDSYVYSYDVVSVLVLLGLLSVCLSGIPIVFF